MDILSYGLIFGTAVAALGSLDIVKKRFTKTLRIWHKLGLDKYKICRKYKTESGYCLIVKVPIGGSLKDLESYKGKIEKAYGCLCEIEDIEKSKYIAVEIKNKG